MDIHLAVEVSFEAERETIRAHPSQGGARRLFHDVAELPRQGQVLGAAHFATFHEKNVPSDRRPGEANDDTRHVDTVVDFPR